MVKRKHLKQLSDKQLEEVGKIKFKYGFGGKSWKYVLILNAKYASPIVLRERFQIIFLNGKMNFRFH